jgi:predicted nucleic acid-binding protein
VEKKLTVSLDSNVLFSIAYSGTDRSRSYLLYELQDAGDIEIYISNLVKEEAIFNIKIKKPAASPFLSTLIRHTTVLEDILVNMNIPIQMLPDNDKIILSTAIHNGMEYFITGNERDFRDLYQKRFYRTTVLKPAEFLCRRF